MIEKVHHGSNLDVLKTYQDNYFDSVVTDPPYGINFMNKKWDYDVPNVELWQEVFRVLKPGGHMLVACGTRTQHRMAVNIEDAGFEVRDIVAWVYGSGFPKSMDISKAIESTILKGSSHSTALRQVEQDGDGESYTLKGKNNGIMGEDRTYDRKEFKPSTEQAKQWEGWGTALKPAMELWTLARKPLNGTVAQNILEYGVGGLNIDGTRIDFVSEEDKGNPLRFQTNNGSGKHGVFNASKDVTSVVGEKGRWPANFIHDGSDEVVKLFPKEAGGGNSTYNFEKTNQQNPVNIITNIKSGHHFGDSGSASRFFYVPKASQEERNFGLYDFEEKYESVDLPSEIENDIKRLLNI